MKFKLEFTFDISDSSLLIDANDGRSEEYTSLEDVPEDTLMDVVYNYLDGVSFTKNLWKHLIFQNIYLIGRILQL